ncbi:hypothetical protein V8C43DRAFT_284951, partial [Trichoderma afarasin]
MGHETPKTLVYTKTLKIHVSPRTRTVAFQSRPSSLFFLSFCLSVLRRLLIVLHCIAATIDILETFIWSICARTCFH